MLDNKILDPEKFKITPDKNLLELLELGNKAFTELSDRPNPYFKPKYAININTYYIKNFCNNYNEYLYFRQKKLPEDFVVINQSDEGFKESTEKEIELLKRNNKNNKSLSASNIASLRLISYLLNCSRGYHLGVDLKVWRLINSSLRCLQSGDVNGAGSIARAALESVVRFADFSEQLDTIISQLPKTSKAISQLGKIDCKVWENLIIKHVWNTRNFYGNASLSVREEIESESVMESLRKQDKIKNNKFPQKNCLQNRYNLLCDLAHPNHFSHMSGLADLAVSDSNTDILFFSKSYKTNGMQAQLILNILFCISFSAHIMVKRPNSYLPNFERMLKVMGNPKYKFLDHILITTRKRFL